MFVSEDLKKLAIYIVEREVIVPKKPEENWFHASLMLVDETKDKLAVIQSLQYSNQNNTFYPDLRRGLSVRVFNNPLEVKVFPVIGGDEIYMMNIWNRILAHACFVKDIGFSFEDGFKTDPFSSNCRDGVIKALRSVGITSHHEMYKGVAGTKSHGLPSSLPSPLKEEVRLSGVYARHTELTDKLDIDSTMGERITRPIKGYFPSIYRRMSFG